MRRFISEDNKTINLPIPLGTTIYVVETKCGDFCLFQKELFDKYFPKTPEGRCSSEMPCHTRKFRVAETTLSLSNLDWVLNNWETKCFAEKTRAEKALEDKIKLNIDTMKKLGFKMQENGYSITGKDDVDV